MVLDQEKKDGERNESIGKGKWRGERGERKERKEEIEENRTEGINKGGN